MVDMMKERNLEMGKASSNAEGNMEDMDLKLKLMEANFLRLENIKALNARISEVEVSLIM